MKEIEDRPQRRVVAGADFDDDARHPRVGPVLDRTGLGAPEVLRFTVGKAPETGSEEHEETITTNPIDEAEDNYSTNRYSDDDQRGFMGLKYIFAYMAALYGFIQVMDIAYKDCYACTMSFAVALIFSALIMVGIILSTNLGHEINFVFLQIHNILLIFAFISSMPLMFRPIKDKFSMLIIMWFMYVVIVAVGLCKKKKLSLIITVAVALYEKILSSIGMATDRVRGGSVLTRT
ncbi:hypothetical protein Droror1_Dr00013931 [Drosera rotundifolia]